MSIFVDKSMLYQTMAQAWETCIRLEPYERTEKFEEIVKEFIKTQDNSSFVEIPSMSPSGNFNSTTRADEMLYNKISDSKNEIIRKISSQNNQHLYFSGFFSLLVCAFVLYSNN